MNLPVGGNRLEELRRGLGRYVFHQDMLQINFSSAFNRDIYREVILVFKGVAFLLPQLMMMMTAMIMMVMMIFNPNISIFMLYTYHKGL